MENSKLFQAISQGKEEDTLSLLADPENDEELKLRDTNGHTLLHLAVLKIKSVNIFKELAKKVDVTVRDEDGNSAIDLVLEDDDFPDDAEDFIRGYMKERVKCGSKEDLELMTMSGWLNWLDLTDDDEELEDDKEDVKEVIKELPGKVEKVKKIHSAVAESNWDIVKDMLEDKTLLSMPDRSGLLPLHKAVILGETIIAENIAKEFIEALTLKDNMGRTALHHAAGCRDGGYIYKILTDAGAEEDTPDLNGKTPKEIYEDPDILPNEKTFEKLKAIMAKPQLSSKRKKQVQAEQQTEDTDEEAKPATPSEKPPTPKPTQKVDEKPKPVQMYISPDVRPNPPPTTIDGKYVSDHLGLALTDALAEIAEKRPWDPIEFLGQWLYKYHENMEYNKRQKDILAQIREEEKAKELEREIKEKRRREYQRLQEEERKKQQAEEEERKRKEQEELQRKAKEAALSQQPGLETVMEDEEEAPKEKSHKDENGQTELHKLAAQNAADLTTLLNMGYSPADRDANNKTARDIAEECKIKENVEAIDNYMLKLMEMGEYEKVHELLLAGYDKFDAAVDKLKEQTHSLPEETKQFLDELPALQSGMSAIFQAVQSEDLSDLTKALETQKHAVAKDAQGRSPLHIAVLVGHKEAAEHLAKNFPIAMRSKDNMERTPLHYAKALSEDMVDILEKHGADTLAVDVLQRKPSFYKENPDDIKSMTGSLKSFYTGTQEQTEQETGQQEVNAEQVPSQQEVNAEQVPSQQEVNAEQVPSQQEATGQQQIE